MRSPAPQRITTDAQLQAALVNLITSDPRLDPIAAIAGTPPLRRRPAGFAGLAAIVVAQQISTAAAAAIWSRLEAALDPLDHYGVLRARADRLTRAGLSAPKVRALKAIARAIEDGDLDLAAVAKAPEVARELARQLGRDEAWQWRQVARFSETASRFLV